ncbi:hypothetical protein BC830DRAFT_1154433 [Chytriomyces sp. MP71]|nr:hypothetical protein BC830DRAFT_1154433 [Chytriomyces sp. MP71]
MSETPSLRARIEHELGTETYECSICVSAIAVSDAIHSCDVCFAVLHLWCAEEWAETSGEAFDDGTIGGAWRCPCCQTQKWTFPAGVCYCGSAYGSEENEYEAWFEVPHSCGLDCPTERDCLHSCPLPCHPGPCTLCQQDVKSICYCGKKSFQHICSKRPETLECDAICGSLLACGSHRCEKHCHSGPCLPCSVQVQQGCICKKSSQAVPCDVAASSIYYACGKVCETLYACQKHTCPETCHSHGESIRPCPYDPEVLLKCPCGNMKFTVEVSKQKRAGCEDPLLLCDDICWKEMSCAHFCKQECHVGPCTFCFEKIIMSCQCGSKTIVVNCSEARLISVVPACTTQCKRMKHCGRHHCLKKCCPKVALEHESEQQDPHYCGLPCGRTLKCGKHECPLECHRGPCPRCIEATFAEIQCACGKTVLEPPIPCGEPQYPTCSFPCTLPRDCGHAIPSHVCHHPSNPCPPCRFLVPRICRCGKGTVKSAICSSATLPSCGKPCLSTKSCGHTCKQVCHAGPCLTVKCDRPCGKMRLECSHECRYPCHEGSPCIEAGGCGALVRVSCECGFREATRSCVQVSSARGATLEWIARGGDLAGEEKRSPVDAKGKLWCNAECEAMKSEENRTVHYPKDLVDYAESNIEFAILITNAFANLLEALQKFYTFAPMKQEQRDFIEALAEHYGILTETEDEEPNAFIVAQRVLSSERPKILLPKAVDLKRRGLLIIGVEEAAQDSTAVEVERKPKLPKGFARPIAVPTREAVRVSNTFELLNLEERD